MNYRLKNRLTAYGFEAIMILMATIFVIPFYYLIVNTFKSSNEATFSPMALPKELHLENYARAFESIEFFRSFSNTFIITVASVFFIIFFGVMGAYPIARRKNWFTKAMLVYFLLGFMVPIQTTMLPLVVMMRNLNLQDSIIGIIVLYTSKCNFALFMYSSFLSTVPRDLEEAALIDGCNVRQSFWKVVFPLLKPVTTTIIIFEVMGIWNDFLLPYLFLNSPESSTMIMAVYKGIGQFRSDWSLMLCTMVIVLLPVFIFYLFMQKHIISGLTSGAVKG